MLTAERLSRDFGRRRAVEDVSLDVRSGEILALLGPNGAGKTTTLRMLAALIAPTSGTVRIDGEAIAQRTAGRLRARVGFLTEAPGLWDRLSVRDNLMVYARLHDLRSATAVVDAALTRFGIAQRADDRAAQLSKGLKQRVALARTLLHAPDIVLLDEPTSGLDPESARDVRELILRLRDEGKAILVSTHNLDEVDRIATRVAVLRTRLIASDTPAALRSRLFGTRVRITVRRDAAHHALALHPLGVSPTVVDDTLYLTVSGDVPPVPSVVRALVAHGADVESVVPEQPSLEEVYLRLLGEEHSRA